MKNVKTIILIILGIIIASVVVTKAATLISSSQVIYKDNQNLDATLDNLYDELQVGKDKVAEAITAKGVEATVDNTLEEMASKINSIETGNQYLRYNEDTGYIQVLDQDGNWQDYALCNELPIPTSDLLYLNGTEYITWTEDSLIQNTYSLVDAVTKYADRLVISSIGTGQATSGGIAGRYTFDRKFNYLHIMNSDGAVITMDCSSLVGTYYIGFNISGWDGVFRLFISSTKYYRTPDEAVAVKVMSGDSLKVSSTVTITKIWMDNNAS